ncbi:MAG TPA: hypothetical protein VM580_34650 [Labilithrix sp.]|nr:hypothetical protein [Labilithrix sp.]
MTVTSKASFVGLAVLALPAGCDSEAFERSDVNVSIETSTEVTSRNALFAPAAPQFASQSAPSNAPNSLLAPEPIQVACPDDPAYFVPDVSLTCAPLNAVGGAWIGELAAPGTGLNVCRYIWLSLDGTRPPEWPHPKNLASRGFPDCARDRGGLEELPSNARPSAASGALRPHVASDQFPYPGPAQCPTCGIISKGALVGVLRDDLARTTVVDAHIYGGSTHAHLGSVHFTPNGHQVVVVDLAATGMSFPDGASAVFKSPYP